LVLDFSEDLCPNEICASHDPSGTLIYRDDVHITVPAALKLTDTFRQALTRLYPRPW